MDDMNAHEAPADTIVISEVASNSGHGEWIWIDLATTGLIHIGNPDDTYAFFPSNTTFEDFC